MRKPTVFNYQDYERLKEENEKLKEEITNLKIRCRIAEGRPQVAYICSMEKKTCRGGEPGCKIDGPDRCMHTTDVAYARNFIKVGDGYYEMTEEEKKKWRNEDGNESETRNEKPQESQDAGVQK